jgi:DnaJ homolog subfamily C member 17
MSETLIPNLDLYDILKTSPSATDPEIRHAYRRRAVVLHPDKNKSSTAEDDFHLLRVAFDILISPTARAAYDALCKAKAAKAERTAKYDDKRRQMQRDLEEAELESSSKRRRVNGERAHVEAEERAFQMELTKLREESERLKAERDRKIQEELAKQEEAERIQHEKDEKDDKEGEDEGERTIQIKFQKWVDRETLTADLLGQVFSRYGEVENVLLRKSALVVFQDAEAAKDAISGISVSGDPIVSQIKQVTLVSPAPVAPSNGAPRSTGVTKKEESQVEKPAVEAQPLQTANFSFKAPMTMATGGVDYESITLMRMRKIEKERLEREIREQEAWQDMETNVS